ncbi:MAG TPA: HAMP domain-containing protein [Spirochaetes bacterium]|nr:HAMP domain-containing protein [Spirochaetota bacterium]
MARKIDARFEKRGLVLKAAAPIMANNRRIGIIYGAKLLNKNYEIVDRIKSLVFEDRQYDGFDYGTATIFLDDLRISTNVQKNGMRAIGTRVSEEVYNRIFKEKQLWLDKAFVVNNWYISAYSPIYNINNEAIGILYVGILEKKFDDIKKETSIFYLIIIVISLQIAILLSIYLIQNILNPVKTLMNASSQIVKGNYDIKISIDSTDELGYLCRAFNTMVDAIVERDNMLKEDTQRQILQSEKMASLGKLAAGIAHEINNPLTGVLTYSSILLEELKDTEHQEDLKIIVNETLRCRKIVREILNFARETRIEKEMTDVNTIIQETLLILEKHIAFQNISIIKDFSPNLPPLNADVNQIKQVVNNLALNAADAMSGGGTLTISTQHDSVSNSITVAFTDTGHGIPPENLDKIFDPFFSTKQTGKGTGLGLAVTYGIVQRHNGTITVNSKINKGTTFTIKLPLDAGEVEQ